MKKFVVDRVDEKTIVLEKSDRRTFCVPLELYPNAREGDVLMVDILTDETNNRKENSTNRMKRIFRK